jgi:hypothetical protein
MRYAVAILDHLDGDDDIAIVIVTAPDPVSAMIRGARTILAHPQHWLDNLDILGSVGAVQTIFSDTNMAISRPLPLD